MKIMIISQFKIVVIIALTITLSFAIIGNSYDGIVLIYGQTIDSDNNNDNIIKLEDITTKHVKVGDIDII
jgi:hypothetical protein